jgi:SET domain-containing protein
VLLKIGPSPLHGRGCFATRPISPGETVAVAPVLIFSPEETAHLFRTNLKNYLFYVKDGATPDGPFFTALALGPISLCNHAADPTCHFEIDENKGEIRLAAERRLADGEEITISYGDWAEEII